MIVKTGCDIVHIGRFQKSARTGGRRFLDAVFSTHELAARNNLKTLAGFFAAKEAIIKALGRAARGWRAIEISKDAAGRPLCTLHDSPENFLSADISISHDGDYAIAVAVCILKGNDTHRNS